MCKLEKSTKHPLYISDHVAVQECLTEQIQILQGKISVLEDELDKLSQQHQEKGEVLGPIVEVGVMVQSTSNLCALLLLLLFFCLGHY